jgi:hypothetical protein
MKHLLTPFLSLTKLQAKLIYGFYIFNDYKVNVYFENM